MNKRATGAVMAGLIAVALTATPAQAAKPGGGARYLGVAECAVDVSDNGTVLTRSHVVRNGRVQALPGGLTGATAINDSGQILGVAGSDTVLWDGARTVVLSPAVDAEGRELVFQDVSPSGVTVGVVYGTWPSEEQTAFRRAADGTVTLLTAPGVRSGVSAINAAGQVVGYVWDGDLQVAVRWEVDGTMTRLPSLGGHSLATAINDAGQAVGYSYRTGGTMEPVIWPVSGAVTALGGVGLASAINTRGDVVGQHWSPQVGFVRSHKGNLRDVPLDPAGTLVLTAVNDRGLAVGCEFVGEGEAAVIVR